MTQFAPTAAAQPGASMGMNPCGEPGTLRQAADAWRTMSTQLGQAQECLSTCAGQLGDQWQGSSAGGFQDWYAQTAGRCGQETDRMNQVPGMLEDMAGQAEHGNQQVCAAQAMGAAGPLGPGQSQPTILPSPPLPGQNPTAPGDPMGVLQPILAQLGQALAALAQALQSLHGGGGATDPTSPTGCPNPTPGEPPLQPTEPVGDCDDAGEEYGHGEEGGGGDDEGGGDDTGDDTGGYAPGGPGGGYGPGGPGGGGVPGAGGYSPGWPGGGGYGPGGPGGGPGGIPCPPVHAEPLIGGGPAGV